MQQQATDMAKALGQRTVRLISFSVNLGIQIPGACYNLCKPVLQAIPDWFNSVTSHLAALAFTGAYKQYSNTNTQRFHSAQNNGGYGSTYEQALQELKDGQKKSHWIWYVLPIVGGLGSSATNEYFSIKSIDDAKQYWNDPVLRRRLVECFQAINSHTGSIGSILGADAWKCHACATLFNMTSDNPDPVFQKTLDHFFGGQPHRQTNHLVNTMAESSDVHDGGRHLTH